MKEQCRLIVGDLLSTEQGKKHVVIAVSELDGVDDDVQVKYVQNQFKHNPHKPDYILVKRSLFGKCDESTWYIRPFQNKPKNCVGYMMNGNYIHISKYTPENREYRDKFFSCHDRYETVDVYNTYSM